MRTKKSTKGIDQAARMAFEELCARTTEATTARRAKARQGKYKQWQGAASRFKGLSEAMRMKMETRNIHPGEDAYVVSFTRNGETFSRRFYGSDDETLAAAVKFRDEALKILGEKNASIPARVLKSLGLSGPVPGISYYGKMNAFVVHEATAKKAGMPRAYPLDLLSEEDAYAAAIECVELAMKAGG